MASYLPLDVLSTILSFAGGETAVRCSSVCKDWNLACQDDSFWQSLCRRDYMAKEKTAATWRQEWRELTDYGRWFDESFKAACATHTVVQNEIVVAVCISRDDSAVCSVGHDSNFCLFDLNTNTFKFKISTPEAYLWSMVVNEDSGTAYIGGHDLQVVDIATGAVTTTDVRGGSNLGGAALHKDGNLLAVSAVEDTSQAIRVFDVRAGFQPIYKASGSDSWSCCWAGDMLAWTDKNHTLRVANIPMNKDMYAFDDHNNTIRGMRSLNDTLLATACYDRKARVFDLSSGELIESYKTNYDANNVAFDLRKLVVACDSSEILLFDRRKPDAEARTFTHDSVNRGVDMSRTKIVSGSSENTFRVWDFTRREGEDSKDVTK